MTGFEGNGCCQGQNHEYCVLSQDPFIHTHNRSHRKLYISNAPSLTIQMVRKAVYKTRTVSSGFHSSLEEVLNPYYPPLTDKTIRRTVAYQDGIQFIDDQGRTDVPLKITTCSSNEIVWEKEGFLQWGTKQDNEGGVYIDGQGQLSWDGELAKRNVYFEYTSPVLVRVRLFVAGFEDLRWNVEWLNFTYPPYPVPVGMINWTPPISITNLQVSSYLYLLGAIRYNEKTFNFCGCESCINNHFRLTEEGEPVFQQFQWDENSINFKTVPPSSSHGSGINHEPFSCDPNTRTMHSYINYLKIKTIKYHFHDSEN